MTGHKEKLFGVVTWNEKGFWQADVFTAEDNETPNWFCTGTKGGEPKEVADKVFSEFGGDVEVTMGFYGECADCGEGQIFPDGSCADCGGAIDVY
jgi:hypothetical protein